MQLDDVFRNKKQSSLPAWCFAALIATIFFEYLRPQDSYLSFLAPLKLPFLVVLSLVYIFWRSDKSFILKERGYKLIIAFWLLTGVSIAWSHNIFGPYKHSMEIFWFMLGFMFPLVAILYDRQRFENYLYAWLIVQTLLGLFVILHGGVGPGGILEDENDVASILVMSFPYAFYLMMFPEKTQKHRFAILLCAGLILGGIVATQSRGGAVGLVCVLLTLIFLSKRPIRNSVTIFLVIFVTSGLILSMLPAEYIADFEEIGDPSAGTGDERIWSWSLGWVMFLDNPFLGVGAGNYPWTNHLYYELSPMYEEGRRYLRGRASHSVYFTVLPELGLAGTILFFTIVKVALNRCVEIKNRIKPFVAIPEAQKTYLMQNVFIASLVGFMVTGVFVSTLYYPFVWQLFGLIFGFYPLAIKQIKALEEKQPDSNTLSDRVDPIKLKIIQKM